MRNTLIASAGMVLLAACGVAVAAQALAQVSRPGCKHTAPASDNTTQQPHCQPPKSWRNYNQDYVDPETIKDFENNGIKVGYDLYDSNESCS